MTLETEILTAIQDLKNKLKEEKFLSEQDFEVLIIASIFEELQHEHK